MDSNNYRLNHQGFGLFEAIMAAALLSVGLMGITFMVNIIADSRERNLFINGALTMESSIATSFTDSAAYGPNAVQAMQFGDIPAALNFVIKFSGYGLEDGVFRVNAGTNPSRNDLVIMERWRVRVGTRRLNNSTPYVYGLAYMITSVKLKSGSFERIEEFNASKHQEQNWIQPFGAKKYPFSENDYVYLAPISVQLKAQPSATAVSCDLKTTLGMYGIDPDTGNLLCLNRPSTPCPAGTLIEGIEVKDGNVGWVCSQPLKKAVCTDPFYSLSAINPMSLFRHQKETWNYAASPGTCTFVAADSATYGTTFYSSGGFNGAVCPPGYRLPAGVAACEQYKTASLSGKCVNYTYNPVSVDYYDPTTGKNMRKTIYEATENSTTVAAAAGTLTEPQLGGFRDPNTNQWMVNCQMSIPAQSCGAKWSALVRVRAQCELDPNFFPPQKPASYQ